MRIIKVQFLPHRFELQAENFWRVSMSRFALAAALLVSFAASVQAAEPVSHAKTNGFILCGRWNSCPITSGVRL